jgi:hypothetical protein
MMATPIRNDLVVKVLSCTKLNLPTKDKPPAVFVWYQLYEYPEHDTAIVKSFEPTFNDEQAYNLGVSKELEEYLLSSKVKGVFFETK